MPFDTIEIDVSTLRKRIKRTAWDGFICLITWWEEKAVQRPYAHKRTISIDLLAEMRRAGRSLTGDLVLSQASIYKEVWIPYSLLLILFLYNPERVIEEEFPNPNRKVKMVSQKGRKNVLSIIFGCWASSFLLFRRPLLRQERALIAFVSTPRVKRKETDSLRTEPRSYD